MNRREPDWSEWEPSAEQLEAQVDRLINDTDEALEWLSCEALADDEATGSYHFGAISSVALFRLGMSDTSTPEQCKNIFATLRQRFTDAKLEQITEAALAKAQGDYQDACDEARIEAYISRRDAQ